MPTLLDYSGLPIPPQCQGVTLRPLVEGGEDPERPGFCEATHPRAAVVRRMISTREWKLWIYYQGQPSGPPFKEGRPMALYHLTEDPGEERNLAEDPAHAKVRHDLLARLTDWMKRTSDPWLKHLPQLA